MAKILVADDEPPMRQMVRLACERMQHEVHEAVDGPSAVLAYQRVKPDLLILDLGMPGGGGPFVLNSLRFGGARNIAPVLVLSGTLEKSAEEVRQQLGVNMVLSKPFRIPELLASVAQLLVQSAKEAGSRNTEPS